MASLTIPEAFERALQVHQSGRLADAEALYRQILAAEPEHPDALNLLGVVAHQCGRHEVAVELIRRAIGVAPSVPDFYSNLGVALTAQGRPVEAVAAYRRALELDPASAEAHNNLGNVLQGQGHPDEAVAACRRALELRPAFPEAHNNVGDALRDLGRLEEAVTAFRRAVELKPGYAEAHNSLGAAMGQQGQFDEGAEACRTALELRPDYPEACVNLGAILMGQGQLDGAISAFERAIELKPDSPEAYNNLGMALNGQGQLDRAISAFHRALRLRPDYAPACVNLGLALAGQGRHGDAVKAYRRAIELKPDFAEAHNNLGNVLKDQGEFGEAISAFRRALRIKPGYAEAHGNLLYALHFDPDQDERMIAAEHQRWNRQFAEPLKPSILAHSNDRNPDRRLRVGYVSPDFRMHSVAFFLEGLLASHDCDQVEVFCYADHVHDDEATARLRQHAAQWRRITGLGDERVGELIRKDNIDVLVDLAGHTAKNRLLVFARKPAPVQVTWLGYWDSTGMSAMDYRLTDTYADPPGTTEDLHVEQLVRLPGTFACFRPYEGSPAVAARSTQAGDGVTFASFHRLGKLNATLLQCWAGLLLDVPQSRLLLAAGGFNALATRQRFTEFFAERGIAPDRLEFRGWQNLEDYLALHNQVDIVLDSHPLSGHTVGCHALWMGVPVVTLAGKKHGSRMMASVLANLDFEDLIARTPQEYIGTAAKLAADPARLAELRRSLRGRMAASPLMDAARFARNVEQVFRQMWQTWCAG